MTTAAKHVRTLERLLDHVATKARDAEPGSPAHGYFRRERNALLWAMPILRERAGMDRYTPSELTAAADAARDEQAKAERATARQAEHEQFGATVPPADDTRPRSYR